MSAGTDYELWSLGVARYEPGPRWVFHGYRRLNLFQAIQYTNFGYCLRKVIGDRSSTIPLFPILASPEEYQEQGMDED